MPWNNNLAKIWTKMVGPSRPTISELNVYTKHAHKLKSDGRLKILILGSTPEFRDWAFEENMQVWVMDANKDYYKTISREIRHKTILKDSNFRENIIFDKWQNLSIENFFDIVIGDLAIGNIPPNELQTTLQRISNSLKPGGLWLGKSFFVPRNYKSPSLEKICKDFYNKYSNNHPYSYFAFYLTMNCLDKENLLDFKKQYDLLLSLHDQGLIKTETLKYFKNVGWDSQMKFKFYVPSQELYESLLSQFFKIQSIEYGQDIYSKYFPLYICIKEK